MPVNKIASGFCNDFSRELPVEFAAEEQVVLGVSLKGSVG